MSFTEHLNETLLNSLTWQSRNLFSSNNTWDVDWNKKGPGAAIPLGLVGSTRRAGTLIAPRVMIGAAHYQPPSHGRIYRSAMHDNPGDGEPFRIIMREDIRDTNGRATDIQLCLLERDMSYQGEPYPILVDREQQWIDVLVLDGERKAWRGKVVRSGTNFAYGEMEESVVAGDSGHPIFAVARRPNGQVQPLLVGCHHRSTNCPNTGMFVFQIQAICSKWGVEPPSFVGSLQDLGYPPEPKPEPEPPAPPTPDPPANREMPKWMSVVGTQLVIDHDAMVNAGITEMRHTFEKPVERPAKA